MVGKKTLVAGIAYVALHLANSFELLTNGTDLTNTLGPIIATYGGLSALSKVERTKKV